MTNSTPPLMDAVCPDPNCQKKLKVPQSRPDRVLTCPACQTKFQLQVQLSSTVLHVATAGAVPVASGPAPLPFPQAQSPLPSRHRDDDGEDEEPNPTRDGRRPAEPVTGNGKRILLFGLLFTGLALVGFGLAFVIARKPSEKVAVGQKLGLYAGVEIGAKGVKCVAADLSVGPDGYDYDVKFEKTIDLTLGKLLKGDTEFDAKALDEAVAAVKSIYGTMTGTLGVAPEKLVVVASSGLFTKFSNGETADQARQLLAKRVKEATGLDLDAVDSKDEARYAALTCVPPKERGTTLLLDIGSGNTKGGYFEDPTTFTGMALEMGTTTYSDKLAENAAVAPRFRKPAEELRRNLLLDPLTQEVDRKPGLKTRPKVCLIGGTVWAMTTYTHPKEAAQSRVRLSVADIAEYRKQLKKPDQVMVAKELAEGKESADEFDRVQSRFKIDQLLGGADILQSLSEAYQLDRKQLTFFRKGQFAWLIGYIIERAGIEKESK